MKDLTKVHSILLELVTKDLDSVLTHVSNVQLSHTMMKALGVDTSHPCVAVVDHGVQTLNDWARAFEIELQAHHQMHKIENLATTQAKKPPTRLC